jgi:hypothetical protein
MYFPEVRDMEKKRIGGGIVFASRVLSWEF